ncbi:glycerophosphodiester phosphodiesterase family protein [Actinoplanes sp. NPDC049316]|uniref:glycerophosphodiester phosphodiesterase n=1 Tax=Actinoplanes sp. NPDC049316 TaxID=3154727 RepID=UPI00342DB952
MSTHKLLLAAVIPTLLTTATTLIPAPAAAAHAARPSPTAEPTARDAIGRTTATDIARIPAATDPARSPAVHHPSGTNSDRRRTAAGPARNPAATDSAPRQAVAAASCPAVIAHKTGGSHAPENTAPGVGVGKSLGAGTVEIDIRFNKSNFAFAMHDEDVARTTNGTGRVQDLWMPDLQKLSAADYAPWKTDSRYGGFNPDGTPKVRPPYTYEILDAAKKAGVKLLLDVKVTPTRAQADSFVGYLDRSEFRMRDRVIWMANSEAGLRTMRGWYPDLTYYLLERPASGYMRTGDSLKAMGAVAYAVPIGEVRSAAYVDYYHSYGLKVSTWTTDDVALDVPANWSKARSYGVDAVTTDRPDEALTQQGGTACTG